MGPDLSVLNLVVVKKGEGEVPNLTDGHVPRRLGPKRANKIRKLFNLKKVSGSSSSSSSSSSAWTIVTKCFQIVNSSNHYYYGLNSRP